MKGFADDLESLDAVVAALFDASGTLLEANAGFHRLLAESGIVPDGMDPVGTKVSVFFIQPAFAALASAAAGATGLVHQGLLTVGDRNARTRTLRGRVWKLDSGIRLLAEHDVGELERANLAYLELIQTSVRAQGDTGRANIRLRQSEARVVEASLTDLLTGAGNRRRLEQALVEEFSRARRTGQPLCAFMADLDLFKQVNDRHGHAAGDTVLARFAALMREQIRPTDILTRYGGEEFVLLMPHTTLAEGVATAERIRAALTSEIIAPLPEAITASFGVAELVDGEDTAALVARADKAVYAAKQAGRNRVVAAAPGTEI